MWYVTFSMQKIEVKLTGMNFATVISFDCIKLQAIAKTCRKNPKQR